MLAALGLSESQHQQQHSVAAYAAAQHDGRDAQQISRDRAGLPAVAESFINNPDPEGQSEKDKRDLAAQEANAVWAFWALLISCLTAAVAAVGTYLLYEQIKLTREAVQDTGEATQAMVEANKIASNAQRPWIDIEARLVEFKKTDQIISIDWTVCFINSGQMMAENFNCNVRFVTLGADFLEHMKGWFDRFAREDHIRESVLVPKQVSLFAGQANQAIQFLPWETREGMRRDCTLMILAMAAYNIPGDKTRRYAMRGFSIGENRGVVDNRRIIYDSVYNLTLDKLIVQPMGISRAN